MDHNPKKSKALWITLIILLLLIIVGYFVFKNSDKIFGTKSSSIGKMFAPLLGSSKPKDVTNIDTGNGSSNTGGDNTSSDNTNNPNGGSTNGNGGSGGNTGGGVIPAVPVNPSAGNGGSVAIVPPFNPLPTPENTDCKDKDGNLIPCVPDGGPVTITQCSDGLDNDADKLMDANDPGCHIDFNDINPLSYDSTINDESRKKDISATAVGGMCPDDPLVFTEDEKAQLAVLLKQYYLLAPLLRIEDDITLLDYDNETNEELVKQATILINDCKAQKADPSYTGPKEVKNNPYYQNPTPNSESLEYLPGYKIYEWMFNIW
jgi:hypothetical protein